MKIAEVSEQYTVWYMVHGTAAGQSLEHKQVIKKITVYIIEPRVCNG
jgi:hypothetical protein